MKEWDCATDDEVIFANRQFVKKIVAIKISMSGFLI